MFKWKGRTTFLWFQTSVGHFVCCLRTAKQSEDGTTRLLREIYLALSRIGRSGATEVALIDSKITKPKTYTINFSQACTVTSSKPLQRYASFDHFLHLVLSGSSDEEKKLCVSNDHDETKCCEY